MSNVASQKKKKIINPIINGNKTIQSTGNNTTNNNNTEHTIDYTPPLNKRQNVVRYANFNYKRLYFF